MDKSADMQEAGKGFAQVVIPSPVKDPLLYKVPSTLQSSLAVGMRVLVPLGKRKITGVVFDFAQETSLEKVREILTVLDDRPVLDPVNLSFCRWISKYYIAPLGDVLAAALPPVLRLESQRLVVHREASPRLSGKLEKEIFEVVAKRRKILLKTLVRQFSGGGVYQALNRLVSSGAVEIEEKLRANRKRELNSETGGGSEVGLSSLPGFALTGEQTSALQSMEQRLMRGGFETFLLSGVTGSGKTEVYMRAMEKVWRDKKRSLILVPEISLTPQLLDRLNERFPGQVGILHSGLTSAERSTQWWRITQGEVSVVVGARSAIFAPVPDLGLIIVDEEHDSSYKQEEGLRYQARDLAVVRGKLTDCPVLLGSATPSVESFHNCRLGRYRLLELTGRVEQRALPRVEIVDLREQLRNQPPSSSNASPATNLFSPQLKEALAANQASGQQSLIFLNRRGFANFLLCGLCGFVIRCPQCSISLTLHQKEHSIFCHHCGFRKPQTDQCPECNNSSLSAIGFGTEKLEEELLRLFPSARIGRMDRDTTSKRGSQERLLRQWEKGEMEILVGTQMITKGHDVAGVTLVGVILADLSLNLPDFRAAERTFQLLLQVAGRSGRGKEPGKVIIQTFVPDHYSFQFANTHDYDGFFASELEFRQALNYPPFSRLIQLRMDGLKAQEVEDRARSMGQKLRKHQQDARGTEQIEILGPAPAPIEKLRNRYRWQILLKGNKGPHLFKLAHYARSLNTGSRVRLHVDVDPYNML